MTVSLILLTNPIITLLLTAKEHVLFVALMTLINQNRMGRSTASSSSRLLCELHLEIPDQLYSMGEQDAI